MTSKEVCKCGNVESLPGEEWRAIEDFPMYRVSNLGRIWSFFKEGPLIANCHYYNYPRVQLINPDGRAQPRVHYLVAAAFLGPKPIGMVLRHLNGNKQDARLVNLAYGTPRENYDDAVRLGELKGPKFKPEQVLAIRERSATGESRTSLAKEFGVRQQTILRIVRGESWKSL